VNKDKAKMNFLIEKQNKILPSHLRAFVVKEGVR